MELQLERKQHYVIALKPPLGNFPSGSTQTYAVIIIIMYFAQLVSKQIHSRQYNDTVCEQDIPGSYER